MPINDDSENDILNPTATTPLSELMVGRRTLLAGGFASAAVLFFGTPASASSGSGSVASAAAKTKLSSGVGGPSLGFSSIAASTVDGVVVPEGYTADAILAWGDPIMSDGPAFSEDASNSAADQQLQMGMGHDGIQYFPLEDENAHGILAMNHEYTTNNLLFPDGDADWTAEKTLKEQAAHGVAVVEVMKGDDGSWGPVDSDRNRRITPNTPMEFTGPATGHRLVQTDGDPEGVAPVGTLNNCGNGVTPWGTLLTTEENFNGYFWEETEGAADAITAEQAEINARYGVAGTGFGYQWASTDERWRADLNPNEPNRFGWIVEIDPYDPTSTPKKRTALGRFKHEGAAVTTSKNGRAVVYMGDDQRFDYLYKFVSKYPWQQEIDAGRSPLDEGTLYAAVFNGDGTGQWQPLTAGRGPLTSDKGFADQGDIVVKARMAADLYGATPMDRPEWTTVHPERPYEGFVTLTNNTRRTSPNPANPRVENRWGHIIRWEENSYPTGRDPESTTFRWEFFVIAGPGDGVDGSTTTASDNFGSPDGLWMDNNNRLWIQTDGGQPDGANNQMLCANTETSEIKRFLTGPVDCEVTGAAQTPDGTTMFINIQHPGDGGTPEDPSATSSFPNGGRPRPATVVIQKDDGGVIGT